MFQNSILYIGNENENTYFIYIYIIRDSHIFLLENGIKWYEWFLARTVRFRRSIFFGSPLPNVYPVISWCDELQLLIRVRSSIPPFLSSCWIDFFFPRRPLFLRLLSHRKHTLTLSSLFEQTSQLIPEENVLSILESLHSHANILELPRFSLNLFFFNFIRIIFQSKR